jgi:hypothetical protein
MKKHHIHGTVSFQHLGTGFWGIIDEHGREWRPVNMPEQLKKAGKSVDVTVKEVDEMSIFMWGTPVEIVKFNT